MAATMNHADMCELGTAFHLPVAGLLRSSLLYASSGRCGCSWRRVLRGRVVMSMHGSDFGVGVDAGEGFRGRGVRISITGIRLGALRSRSGVICIGPTALRGVTSDRHASTSYAH